MEKSSFISSSSDATQPKSGFAALSGGSGFGGFGGSSSSTLKPFVPIGGAKSGKAFGSTSDDEAEGSDNDTTAEEPGSFEPEETDARFYAQSREYTKRQITAYFLVLTACIVESGEEGESTLFQQRAKLFVFKDKSMKERGVGMLKVNIRSSPSELVDTEPQSETSARFLLRADGSHRVALNSPITGTTNLRDPASQGAPNGNTLMFLGIEDGKPQIMKIRVRLVRYLRSLSVTYASNHSSRAMPKLTHFTMSSNMSLTDCLRDEAGRSWFGA